jgi:hypothetical protein
MGPAHSGQGAAAAALATTRAPDVDWPLWRYCSQRVAIVVLSAASVSSESAPSFFYVGADKDLLDLLVVDDDTRGAQMRSDAAGVLAGMVDHREQHVDHAGQIQGRMGTEGGRGRLTFALPSLGDLGRGAFRVGVHVHEQGRHALSADLVRLDQALERVVHTQAHQRFELFVRVTARGLSDEEDQRRAQGSPRREADLPVEPQPVLVEDGNGLQRVVAPGVAVAGHVAHAIEHAEHGSL